ncbi:hypothetical protein ACJJTC_006626 [Scirpophaga incertulas]
MTAVMKLKTLQGHLQQLDGFCKPKIKLEQYETPPHIAAVMFCHFTFTKTFQTQYEALEGKQILDAGCGTGTLSIGAALMGSEFVTAVDIDVDALHIFKNNVDEMEIGNIGSVQCNLLDCSNFRWTNYFDTVLMNPPFGTKNNAGIDMKFLHMGLLLSNDSVYSLHKSSTRMHIQKKIKEWDATGSVIAELRYDLPATYKFHKEQSRDIAVDLWRVYKTSDM